jgi:hypothetical protein
MTWRMLLSWTTKSGSRVVYIIVVCVCDVDDCEIPKHMLADIFTVTARAVPVFDDMEDAPIMDD